MCKLANINSLIKVARSVDDARKQAIDIIRPYILGSGIPTLGLGTPIGALMGRSKAIKQGVPPGIADQTATRMMCQGSPIAWVAFGLPALFGAPYAKHMFTMGMPKDKPSKGSLNKNPSADIQYILNTAAGKPVSEHDIPNFTEQQRLDAEDLFRLQYGEDLGKILSDLFLNGN